MDEITLRQIRKVLNTEAAGLTDFEQTLIQWYFLMDQSRPSFAGFAATLFAGFAATLKVEKLDRGVVEASLQKALGEVADASREVQDHVG